MPNLKSKHRINSVNASLGTQARPCLYAAPVVDVPPSYVHILQRLRRSLRLLIAAFSARVPSLLDLTVPRAVVLGDLEPGWNRWRGGAGLLMEESTEYRDGGGHDGGGALGSTAIVEIDYGNCPLLASTTISHPMYWDSLTHVRMPDCHQSWDLRKARGSGKDSHCLSQKAPSTSRSYEPLPSR
jgi:hypothetical protein